ncbi:MAG: hypothetical protein WC755_07975 [Candidatus Woesearchaeota archaeon]|jgi:hypothetical protein
MEDTLTDEQLKSYLLFELEIEKNIPEVDRWKVMCFISDTKLPDLVPSRMITKSQQLREKLYFRQCKEEPMYLLQERLEIYKRMHEFYTYLENYGGYRNKQLVEVGILPTERLGLAISELEKRLN